MTVAIIGPGTIGAAHAAAWREVGVEVSHLVSRRADATLQDAPNARAVADLDVVLGDPSVDIVTICTPTPTHREFAVASLRAGKNVLLEKPMALSMDDAEAIAKEAGSSGGVLMVGHVVRFFDAYLRVRELVEAGAVGHPFHVRAERMIAPPDTPWWFDEERSGGVAVDLGIHDLDQANLLLGHPIGVRSAATHPLGPVETTVRYDDGGLAQGMSHARMPATTSFATALQVTGDAGVVATRFIGGERPVEEFTVRGAVDAGDAEPAEPTNPYARQAAHFLECVASGTPSAIAPVDDAILALSTALAARDSLRAGGAWMPVS
ncbi:Gfo/Idh/MocA family protein [Humibacter sp.]|uniref:Gfo/Idh/MocA family protein n=1 Tax=Humibacter sp. TaxID=1940291 RepID=UPI003F7CED27